MAKALDLLAKVRRFAQLPLKSPLKQLYSLSEINNCVKKLMELKVSSLADLARGAEFVVIDTAQRSLNMKQSSGSRSESYCVDV
jgi:hypothetical protein